jgi:hypothetical protein
MQTITTYRNAGLPKISDKAMLYLLFGFVELPFAALRLAVWYWRQGPRNGFHPIDAWRTVYARQMQIWRWI